MTFQLNVPGVGYLTVPPIALVESAQTVQTIVDYARGVLSDTDVTALRWSESRLVDLASKAQEDFNIRTKFLKRRVPLTVIPANNEQVLSLKTRLLTRVLYNNIPVQIISHEMADEKFGLGWETVEGASVIAIVYDRLEPNKFKTYPTLNGADLNLVCYTLIKADTIKLSGSLGSYVYGILQIPEVYHYILEYFVTGMALRDDQDTANRALATEHLAMYENLVATVVSDANDMTHSTPRSAIGTDPLERSITDVRYVLGDELSDGWTEERLVRLYSKAQEDINERTNILKAKVTVTIDPSELVQVLPVNTLDVYRIVYADTNMSVPLYTHEEMDERFGVRWESETGVKVRAIVYDKLNANRLKVYPIMVAPTAGFTAAELELYVYTSIKPTELVLSGYAGNFTYPTIQLPDSYITTMEYYVIGMALRDSGDEVKRQFSKDNLAMYADLIGNKKDDRSRVNVSNEHTQRNKPDYNRAI